MLWRLFLVASAVCLASITPANAQFVCAQGDTINVAGSLLSISISSDGALAGANSVGCGTNSVASGTNSVALGAGTLASGDSSLALGQGANASQAGSVAIGSGVTTTAPDQIAIGSGTSTVRLQGVTSLASTAAQVGPLSVVTTDSGGNIAAIDVSSLVQSAPEFTTINNRLDNHEARLGRVESGLVAANRGVAAAMSLAGGATIPPGKTAALSAGWGTFAGQQAIGASAAFAAGGGIYLNGGMAVSGSEVGGRAGVTVAW